jgi:cobaltochelatase CobN
MLRREHGQRQAARPRGLAQERVARQGLLKRVQLTISGCLGPCDIPNIVTISDASGTQWFGEIAEFGQYQAIVEWASRSRDAGEALPLPKEFRRHTLYPFR